MNFFKKISSGYTLLELMLTLSISTLLLTLCFTIHQRQHKKILANGCNLSASKECLDFFTKTTLFINTSISFIQKDGQTLELTLAPDEHHPEGRRLGIQLNAQRRTKDTLNISAKHIQSFLWEYWDSKKNKWENFKRGTPCLNSSFVKVILLDKNRKPLDVFVYSCYVNTQ